MTIGSDNGKSSLEPDSEMKKVEKEKDSLSNKISDLSLVQTIGPQTLDLSSARCGPDTRTQLALDDVKKSDKKSLGSIRPTKKRFLILLMFIILHMIKSFQWICLASVTNVVARFYNVSNIAINWTTILFMVTCLILSLPVTWIMEILGIRKSILVGAFGVTMGLIIKCFSCNRDGFLLGMIGHLIIGLVEPFFFSSYSQVASIWFPDHQVAKATSCALIGEELGLALGFIIPPLMIGNDPEDFVRIQQGLYKLFISIAVISVLNTISIVFFFDEQPASAPGIARLKQIQANTERQLKTGGGTLKNVANQLNQLGQILTDKNFLLLLAGFGINVGTAYSIHTLLNQMIIRPEAEYQATRLLAPDDAPGGGTTNSSTSLLINQIVPTTGTLQWDNEDANLVVGNSGLILIVAGLFGSATCGALLDKFHRYKLTTALVYLLTVISMAALTTCLALESALTLYLVTLPLGFALTGYASCGYDYGVEITYPRAELLSSTVLNISAQIFGIPISLIGSYIVDLYGNQALGLFLCLVLLVGFLLTCLQGGELRRQSAVKEGQVELL